MQQIATGTGLRPENVERAIQDDAEWRTARLHERLHGNWLGPDECSWCLDGEDARMEAKVDQAFEDNPEPVDLNVEGDPTRNGAFR